MRDKIYNPPSAGGKKILIVDDHQILIDTLTISLEEMGYAVQSCNSKEKAITALRKSTKTIDAILLDVVMPDMFGIAGVSDVILHAKETPVILLSSNLSRKFTHEAIHAGARGYIPKTNDLKNLCGVIEFVIAGGIYVPLEMVSDKMEASNPWDLTSTEYKVAQRVSNGLPNKIIADIFGVSESTIKMHIRSIFQKMRVTNRTQVALRFEGSFLDHSDDETEKHGSFARTITTYSTTSENNALSQELTPVFATKKG